MRRKIIFKLFFHLTTCNIAQHTHTMSDYGCVYLIFSLLRSTGRVRPLAISGSKRCNLQIEIVMTTCKKLLSGMCQCGAIFEIAVGGYHPLLIFVLFFLNV
jgi:hypothetical protein